MEIRDEVDDETLNRLRLEEELEAVNTPMNLEEFEKWNMDAPGADVDLALQGEDDEKTKKAKLAEFPELIQGRLKDCVKKYKDAALKRKQAYSAASTRLKDDQSTGYEYHVCSWLDVLRGSCL